MTAAVYEADVDIRSAITHYQSGRFQKSLSDLETVLIEQPDNDDLLYLKALNLIKLQSPQSAVEILETLHERLPDRLNILQGLCRALCECGVGRRAIDLATDFWAKNKSDIQRHLLLIDVLCIFMRFEDAQQVCLKAVRLRPEDPSLWLKLASCFDSDQKVEEAVSVLSQARRIMPDEPDIEYAYAEVIRRLGDKTGAEAVYRSLLKREFSAKSFTGLADVTTIQHQGMLARKAKTALNSNKTSAVDKAVIKFGLAKVCEQAGRYEQAARYFVSANEVLDAKNISTNDRLERTTGQIKADFSDGFCGQTAQGVSTEAPIFIIGMPRCGSTLVEQILSSHSKVAGTGEVPYLPRLTMDLDGKPFSHAFVSYSSERRAEFANAYLDLIRKNYEIKDRFTDKNLSNWRNVGYILTAMPHAKIIHMKRDRRAVDLSIFKTMFGNNVPYSTSPDKLHSYRRLYEDMMAFWEDRFPGKILHVDYENVVLNLEMQSRRLLEYLGIGWEDQVLEFQKNKRAAVTAPYDQVRKGLYRTSLEPWQPYKGTMLAEVLGL